jgi:hypothetical protein
MRRTEAILEARHEATSPQRLLDQADGPALPHESRSLRVPGLHGGLDRILPGDLPQLRSRLAEATAYGGLAALNVQDREPRQHDLVAPQDRVGPELRRTQVQQPRHRGVLPPRRAGRSYGGGPAGWGDELRHTDEDTATSNVCSILAQIRRATVEPVDFK